MFYSFSIEVVMSGNYTYDLLFPVWNREDDFNPFPWMMSCLSDQTCFSYWSPQDKGIYIVNSGDIASASFHHQEERDVFNGIVCYPHMIEALCQHTYELEFSFPDIGGS